MIANGSFLLFGMPGPFEMVVILIVVLLVVGPKKLPELMRALGKSLQSFKKGMRETDLSDDKHDHEQDTDNSALGG